MKKASKRKANKQKSPKDIIGIFYFCICIGVVVYTAIGVPILTSILKTHGIKTEAVITSTTIGGGTRHTTPHYVYEFYVGDKTYEGNSLVDERNTDKIGTKIQILYLDWLPCFNRPIYYWDD